MFLKPLSRRRNMAGNLLDERGDPIELALATQRKDSDATSLFLTGVVKATKSWAVGIEYCDRSGHSLQRAQTVNA
jgi:hypothetical protein